MDFMFILITLLVIFFIIFSVKGFKVVQQAEVMIIERLGVFKEVLGPGLHFIIPVLDNPRGIYWKETRKGMGGQTYSYYIVKERIDTRECVYDFPRQNVITKDNAGIGINALIYFQIVDPKSVAYQIQNLPEAIEKLTQATLRNIVGEMDLDETLSSRTIINEKLRVVLDDASQ